MSQQPTTSNSRSQVPAWVWLFTGAVLGAFIMFLIHLSKINQQHNPTTAKPTEEKADKVQFDFYDILKENNVEVAQSQPENATTKTKHEEYLLQVGSFKSVQDAEQVRAELILLDLPATVQQANIRNGETWHRVMVGPLANKSKMAAARNTLISNNYEALTLKREIH